MDRKNTIDALVGIAEDYAKKRNASNKEVKECGKSPVWGELLNDIIRTYGEKNVEMRWKDDQGETVAEFRYRFTNPVLTIKDNDALASVEFGENKDTGNYEYNESQVFTLKGLYMMNELLAYCADKGLIDMLKR